MKQLMVWMAAILVACAGTQGTDPDDMSAEEHEAHAGDHDSAADEHAEQHEPTATSTISGQAPTLGQMMIGTDIYNPTASHHLESEQHRAIADEHRRAAEQLRAFEAEECGRFPTETRAACPLLGHLASVQDVEGGVRLTFDVNVNQEAVHAHVRCHNAFARARGRAGMDHCPMYVDGVRVEQDESGGTLLLTSGDEAIAAVRSTARAHLNDG